jgi:hypothetical protein
MSTYFLFATAEFQISSLHNPQPRLTLEMDIRHFFFRGKRQRQTTPPSSQAQENTPQTASNQPSGSREFKMQEHQQMQGSAGNSENANVESSMAALEHPEDPYNDHEMASAHSMDNQPFGNQESQVQGSARNSENANAESSMAALEHPEDLYDDHEMASAHSMDNQPFGNQESQV